MSEGMKDGSTEVVHHIFADFLNAIGTVKK